MLSILSSLWPFSSSAKDSKPVVSSRHVDISGHVFSFDLPEGFSKDLPADELIETLSIDSIEQVEDLTAGHLLRRWWDIKEPGWFGDELGTVMLEMSVQKVQPNTLQRIHSKPYDVTDRLDFMLAIEELLMRRYSEHNEEVRNDDGSWNYELAYNVAGIATMLGGRVDARYWNHLANHQMWTRYGVAGANGVLLVNYAIPVNYEAMIELTFTYSPNDNKDARYFLRTAEKTTDPIINSLYVQYPDDSPVKSAVEGQWLTETTDEVLRRNWQRIVKPLFGEKAYELAVEENKKLESLDKVGTD